MNYSQITVMVDIDDVLFPLVDNWIAEYQKQRAWSFKWGILEDEHDKLLDKSMVTSWNIEECLNPTDKELFWRVLDESIFWNCITVSEATKNRLKTLNDHKNIDLIICTDTHYKSATAKLTHFFELFPFIKPSQVICMKEKWRLNPDIVIDDKPETLEKFMLKDDYQRPAAVIKINQPWNTTTICDYTFDSIDDDGLFDTIKDIINSYLDFLKYCQNEREESNNESVTTIKFAKLVDTATIPSGREEDLGLDFYYYDRNTYVVSLPPHKVVKLPTGIIMAMDNNYGMILKERSSLGSKGIAIRAGVIDSGYRGEVIICLENTTDTPYNLDIAKAIAQGILIPNPKKVIEEYTYDEIMAINSKRGDGGFGSTN